MKYFFKLHIAENCQKSMMTYVFVGSIIKFVFAIMLCSFAFYIIISLGNRADFFIRHYNMKTIPIVLNITGFAILVESIIAIKFCFKCLSMKFGSTKVQVIKNNHCCFFFMSCLVLFLTVMTILALVYELQTIHSSFKKGILDAMKSYNVDVTLKEEFDLLQMKYGCCGEEGYKDWFHVKWMDDKYLSKDRIEKIKNDGKYFVDDVPFSCCDKTSLSPCINERVLDEKAHFNYDYRNNLTLYKKGCLPTLWQFYGKQAFMKIAIVFLIVICFQISLTIAARFLQTSIWSELRGDDSVVGWIIALNSEVPKTIIVQDSEENLLK